MLLHKRRLLDQKILKDIFETPEFNQDANDLTKFYWKKARGTVTECAALESLNFCKEYLKRKEVLRDDRKELAELVVGYLSPGHVKIRKPGAIHHARFLGKAIYYLKLKLLSNQLKFVQDDKLLQEEISIMVEFVACFYAKWYLQSDSAIRAPYLDISSLHQMHLYRDVCAKPEAVDAVLESFYKHTWYLDSTIVPLSLLDEDVPYEEKSKIAAAILQHDMPNSDYFKIDNKSLVELKEKIKFEKRVNDGVPSLASLVDKFSYLMFHRIGLDEQRVRDWLSLPPQYWCTQSSFKLFQDFAKTLVVVNDPAERAVRMMQQFVHRYNKEEEIQNRLLTVDKARFAMKRPGKKSSNLSKKRLADGLSSLEENF